MDLFQHRYYRLNKTFMMLLGQWPYQSARDRRAILVVIIFIMITALAPPIMALLKYRDDWSIVIDSLIPCVFGAVYVTKLIGVVWNLQKILMLLNRICTNWRMWAQDREVNILHKYAEQGEKMTIVYTDLSILLEATIYSAIILFTTQPIIPKIIDVMLKNGTEPGKFPNPVNYYFFDAQKYYCYIMMHFYMSACIIAMPLVASDSMLIICVQHVCGLFAAIVYKLKQIENSGTSLEKGGTPFELDKRNFVGLASFIDRHNDAIEYANLIDATYTWTFLFTIGIGLIMINILGLQILMRTDDPESTIRFVAIGFSLGLVFYTQCYISQMLEDHSITIGYYIYNSRWYTLSPRVQKLLQMMMMRCRVPCQLTAGTMLVMSLRTFVVIFRTALSYFAVVRSTNNRLNIAGCTI